MTFIMAVIGAALGYFLSKDQPETNRIIPIVAGAVGAIVGVFVLKSLFSILGFVAIIIGGAIGALAAIWAIARFGNNSGDSD